MILQKGLTVLRKKLEAVYEDEQEAYDNIPEGLLNSERGKKMCECLCELEDGISNLVELEETLKNIAER